MYRRTLIFFTIMIFWMFISSLSYAKDDLKISGALTLERAKSIAIERNPELLAFSWEVRAKEAKVLQAGLLPNPEFGFEAEDFGGSKERSGFHEADFTFRISQLIELARKRAKRRRVAALELNTEKVLYEAKYYDVLNSVTKAFISVLSLQEQLLLSKELLALSEQVYDTVSARVKAGKVSPIEETKASIAVSESRIKFLRVRENLEASKRRLSATWGDRSAKFDRVEGNLYKTTPIPNFDVLLKRISKNPDIARWFKEIQQKEAALELEKARKFPNLTLTGGIRHKSAVDDNVFIMELSIPIPIFNRNQGDILRAKYRLNNAIEMKKVVSLRVTTSLSDAYKDLSKAYEAIKIMDREVLKNAQSTFDAVREGYRQGKFDLLNVLDAQRTLFSVKEQYIMILTSYHTSIAEIERLIGGSGLVNLGK